MALRIPTKNKKEEGRQRQASQAKEPKIVSSWTTLGCFKSNSVEMLQTAKCGDVSTSVSDRSDSPCTAKYIAGSCTHSNFWEAATPSSKMDYSYDILISSLHGLQVRLVSQQIWCGCQVSLDSPWQTPALHPSLPVVAPTDLKMSPNITQLCIRLAEA